jgi:hypothetical protein
LYSKLRRYAKRYGLNLPRIRRIKSNINAQNYEFANLYSIEDAVKVDSHYNQLNLLMNQAKHLHSLKQFKDRDYTFIEMSRRTRILTDLSINKWNDKRSRSCYELNEGVYVEPLQSLVVHNLVPLDARIVIAKQITGYSDTSFHWIAAGTGNLGVSEGRKTLANEHIRSNILEEGFLYPSGAMVVEGTNFSPLCPSARLSEFAAFNAAINGIMFWLSVIEDEDDYLDHRQGETQFGDVHLVYLESNEDVPT